MLFWMSARGFTTLGGLDEVNRILLLAIRESWIDLFDDKAKYKLFARKVWPLLAAKREELAQCYKPENGRASIEAENGVVVGMVAMGSIGRGNSGKVVTDGSFPGLSATAL
jgi:hypothetical protein